MNNIKNYKSFNENMKNEDIKEFIKSYIKENLVISVEDKSFRSDSYYNKHVYVKLYLENELISESEIEDLNKEF